MAKHGAVDDLQTTHALLIVRKEKLEERPVAERSSGDVARFSDLSATEDPIVQSNVGLEHRGEPTNGVVFIRRLT
jgi:hypothetical protein